MKKVLIPFLMTLTGITLCMGQSSEAYPENPGPVKNIIMMIPDGTSTSVLGLSRWYHSYNSDRILWLNVDKMITGLVKTHDSDAPIGDSAPTGSTFATGVTSQAGYVATYPEKTPVDIVPVDASLSNTPAMTILEAAKLKGLATGLVVTCYFPHATPADFSSHTPNRSENSRIVPQMVYNNIDVVFGGGTRYLLPEFRQYLGSNGWDTIFDYKRFLSFSGTKAWGLFAPKELPYDLDRDPSVTPSLAEMTQKALQALSKNGKGFFLMVEGSKVDWAAHANDAAGILTEFLAFDKAVKEAYDFARKDGNTAVIICPDHGNSAISMGNNIALGYSKLSKEQLMSPVMNCKYTAEGFVDKLVRHPYDEDWIRKVFDEDMGIKEISVPEMNAIKVHFKPLQLQSYEKSNNGNLQQAVVNMLNSRSFIGFTTSGHTGEDVFLACYHPQGDILRGTVMNSDVNRYMCDLMGGVSLPDSTRKYFAGHRSVFPEPGYQLSWDTKATAPVLTVTNTRNKKVLQVKAFENKATLIEKKNRRTIGLRSVVIFVEKNNEFYLPADMKRWLD